FIRLNLEEERSAEVQIISILGKLMKTVIISSENKIETSDLPKGIYLIKVKTETETSIQRMIKN
ncbi:MAG: T9SS type A sorting domain-containing protein, partial [Flavobacteriales bacterium]